MALTIPTIPSMPAGHIATSNDMNQLAAAATFLLGKPIAHVHDGTGGYAMASPMTCWDTKDIDTDGMWNGSQTDRLTIQTPGWYKLRVAITSNGAGGSLEFFMRSTTGSNNPLGSGVFSSPNWEAATIASSASPFVSFHVSGIWPYYLYPADFLQVRGVLTAGAGNTYVTAVPASFFSLEWVSA